MRLTVVSYTRRKIGGMEQNLDVVIPELERRGHTLQFVYFHDEPFDRAAIRTSASTALVDAGRLDEKEALLLVREFRPDVINVHGDIGARFQRELLRIAPAAYSVHNYYGTCISGLKTLQFPIVQPCSYTLGPACLLRYFPRRCGGRSPVTMVRRYRAERERLAVMSQYDAVITHSRHMESEYMRHGLHPARVYGLPYEVAPVDTEDSSIARPDVTQRVHLLFAGRMEKLKGGHLFLRSLVEVQTSLKRPIEAHLAGDGPERQKWESLGRGIMERHPEIRVRFHGWLMGSGLSDLLSRTNLVVVPSLWPEPFGKIGPEAATHGIPVAAFDVGGIVEWLQDGVNGRIAPGNPPTAQGLARAIVDCVADAPVYQNLCAGALRSIQRFDLKTHVDHLLGLFERIRADRSGVRAFAAAV